MTTRPSSPRSRRLGLIIAFCLVIQASTPAPALAWFGWLDEWSGPGGFWGLLYEMRLVCFGEQSGVRQIEAAYTRAQRSTLQARAAGANATAADLATAITDWLEVVRSLQAAQAHWQGSTKYQKEVTNLATTLEGLMSGGAEAQKAAIANPKNIVADVHAVLGPVLNGIAGQVIAAGGTGMFWSACSDDKERRLSIELNIDDWRGIKNENNSSFSGGTSVRMITIMPSVTWSVIANKKYDVVDLGVAAGYYSFTSKGFETVNGFIAEPLRVELHAPTSWSAYPRNSPRRWASMVTFRYGLMTVPSGFAANAFAPGSQDGPISAEFVRTTGLFFNLNSLLSNPRKKELPGLQDPAAKP